MALIQEWAPVLQEVPTHLEAVFTQKLPNQAPASQPNSRVLPNDKTK